VVGLGQRTRLSTMGRAVFQEQVRKYDSHIGSLLLLDIVPKNSLHLGSESVDRKVQSK
jgi:hypothetical protein